MLFLDFVFFASHTFCSQVAAQITDLTEGTPLHNCGGSLNNANSYSAVHQNLSKKIGGYADKYQQFVVEYVVGMRHSKA